MQQCKICLSESEYKFTAKILNKYDVKYYECIACQFIQTENPYWLPEAYASAITSQDIGLLYRNNLYAPIVSLMIKLFFDTKARFLDYGGGYGVFVRLMRDRGFDFYRYDTYCENIFASTFDSNDSSLYELITSFEVFEHMVDPIQEIEKMLKKGRSIFFSTELQPKNINGADDWWYVMPETGQHIALYTEKSLRLIADKYHLNFYTNGSTFHLFTSKKISPIMIKAITNHRIQRFLNLVIKDPESFLMKDYQNIKK